MANNILIQLQIDKSVMFILVPHESLQIYLVSVGLLNKYSKHKEFVGYNLLNRIIFYMYNFVDKVKVINLEYNVKKSSLSGMTMQETSFLLSKDINLPIHLYSFDKNNILFLSLEVSQYIQLPIINRAKNGLLSYRVLNNLLTVEVNEETVQVMKQDRNEILAITFEERGQVHRCFFEVKSVMKLLTHLFHDIDEVITSQQLMLLMLNSLVDYLGVRSFIKIIDCKFQVLHKYVRLNVFNFSVNSVKLKCFFYAYDTKIIDKFNKALGKQNVIQNHDVANDFLMNLSVINHSVYIATTELAKLSKNSIVLLGAPMETKENNYAIDLGGQELLCQIHNGCSLKITGIK